MEKLIIEIYEFCKGFIDEDYDLFDEGTSGYFELLYSLCRELNAIEPAWQLELHPFEFREIMRYIEPKFNTIEITDSEKPYIQLLTGIFVQKAKSAIHQSPRSLG